MYSFLERDSYCWDPFPKGNGLAVTNFIFREWASALAILPETCYTLSEKGIQSETPFLSEND